MTTNVNICGCCINRDIPLWDRLKDSEYQEINNRPFTSIIEEIFPDLKFASGLKYNLCKQCSTLVLRSYLLKKLVAVNQQTYQDHFINFMYKKSLLNDVSVAPANVQNVDNVTSCQTGSTLTKKDVNLVNNNTKDSACEHLLLQDSLITIKDEELSEIDQEDTLQFVVEMPMEIDASLIIKSDLTVEKCEDKADMINIQESVMKETNYNIKLPKTNNTVVMDNESNPKQYRIETKYLPMIEYDCKSKEFNDKHEAVNKSSMKEAGIKLKPEKFKCSYCTSEFQYKNYLAVHKQSHFVKKNRKCKKCQQSFHLTLDEFKKHLEMHYLKPIFYKCLLCSKSLDSMDKFKEHQDWHTKIIRDGHGYDCEQCGETFFTLIHFQMHQNMHNKKVHVCDYCKVTFRTALALKEHEQAKRECGLTKTKQKVLENRYRRFRCETCGKVYGTILTFKKHQKTHSKKEKNRKICNAMMQSKESYSHNGSDEDCIVIDKKED